MFLTPTDINQIRNDYEQIVKSNDSCRVTIEYRTWLDPNTDVVIDPVYRVDRRPIRPEPVTVKNVPCLQQIIKTRDEVEKLGTLLLEVGDCIFYFSSSFNFEQPHVDFPLVPDSMVIIDPSDSRWIQKLPRNNPLSLALVLRVGNRQIGQPIACKCQK